MNDPNAGRITPGDNDRAMSADERIDTSSNDSMVASDPPSISLDHDGGLVPSSGYTEPLEPSNTSGVCATFATTREAEMVIEHLVEELGIDRAAIVSEPQAAYTSPGSMGTVTDGRPGACGTREGDSPVSVAITAVDEKQRAEISKLFADFERPSGYESAEI